MKNPPMRICDKWEWDGNLIAFITNDRFAGYQHANDNELSTTDCLCYKFLPSIFDIVSNHRRAVQYSLFGVLRNVGTGVIKHLELT